MIPKNFYSHAQEMDWLDIYKATHAEAKLPLSVHIPLNFPAAKGLTFCDCALNAYYLASPALNSSLPQDRVVRDLQHVKILSFAFGEMPYVPEFRHVRLSRRIGGLPIIHAEFSAWNLVYSLDYCVSPDGVLHIQGAVRNESAAPRQAVVWVHPGNPLEKDIFDYHYVPFSWDASKWLPDNNYRLVGERLYTAFGVCGQFTPGEYEMSWIEKAEFTEGNPNLFFACSTPYRAFPSHLLKTITNTIRLAKELAPHQETAFEIAIDFESQPACLESLAIPYVKAEKATEKQWRSLLKGLPVLELGDTVENQLIEAIRTNNLQLLLDHNGGLRPCQGGSSERFYVWVWEAMCSLRPMLQLGHFKEVRKVIEFIFTLQDGGCPPVGNFTTTAGAIGTSGPKWANTTGSALILASDYLRLSGDKEFEKQYLGKMLRAADWIVGEIRATRIKGSDTYGVMPEARATDGDIGQVIFTDAWTLCGFASFCKLLNHLKHPKAKYYTKECNQYKKDLNAVLERIVQPDGFIPRSYGKDSSQVCHGFRFTCTPVECCAAGLLSANEPKMRNYLAWLEANAFDGLFFSIITPNLYYIGNNELTLMKMYMEQGKEKAAWAAYQTFRRFAITPDLFLTQERYHATDEAFTAWQPNASNNGRVLEMEIARLFYETPDGTIILCGGIAPFERKAGLSLRNLHTQYGKITLTCTDKMLNLKTQTPLPAGKTLVVNGKKYTLDKPQCSFSAPIKPIVQRV